MVAARSVTVALIGVSVLVTMSPNGRSMVARIDGNRKLQQRSGRDQFVARVMAGSHEIAQRLSETGRPDEHIQTREHGKGRHVQLAHADTLERSRISVLRVRLH